MTDQAADFRVAEAASRNASSQERREPVIVSAGLIARRSRRQGVVRHQKGSSRSCQRAAQGFRRQLTQMVAGTADDRLDEDDPLLLGQHRQIGLPEAVEVFPVDQA